MDFLPLMLFPVLATAVVLLRHATPRSRLLRAHDCWVPIWSPGEIGSGHDPQGKAPFCRASRMVRD